ncbi:MAG: monovalent cation/H(+) antiporter subunit G [Actinomycetota bacterium]
METVGEVLMIIGACFALIAAIGVHRFPDAYSRMHAAAKSPTLGLVLACVGATFRLHSWSASLTLLLVVVLQLISSPVATHAIARSVHLRMPVRQDGVDELARDLHDDPNAPTS